MWLFQDGTSRGGRLQLRHRLISGFFCRGTTLRCYEFELNSKQFLFRNKVGCYPLWGWIFFIQTEKGVSLNDL